MIILMDWRFLQRKARTKSDAASSGGRKSVSRVRQLTVAAGLVVLAAAGAGAWFFSQERGRARIASSEPTLASTALTTARDVGAFLRESVTRDLTNIASILRRSGEETLEEADTDAEGEVADAGLAVAPPTVPRRRREPTAPPEVQAGIGPSPWVELPREAPLFMVFDSSHSDVTPPGSGEIRLRSEFLPGALRQLERDRESESGTDTDSGVRQVGLVEVTVSETGEVERAKLVSVPQDVHESMLLSAIKAWRFTPAEKDGMAVRYRQVMPITVAQ